MKATTCTVVASHGVPFTVRLVEAGERYGLDFCLVHDTVDAKRYGPFVEFYDARYRHTRFGQFVSRYYLSTLLERRYPDLTLDGGVEDWRIDGESLGWALKQLTKGEQA